MLRKKQLFKGSFVRIDAFSLLLHWSTFLDSEKFSYGDPHRTTASGITKELDLEVFSENVRTKTVTKHLVAQQVIDISSLSYKVGFLGFFFWYFNHAFLSAALKIYRKYIASNTFPIFFIFHRVKFIVVLCPPFFPGLF